MNNQNIPNLSTVIRTAAREVTSPVKINKDPQDKGINWPRAVTANTKAGMIPMHDLKTASNMYAGGNITLTAPQFYSPFLTPSSFQIPNTRKEIYIWANFWRQNEPKVAAGIEFYTNFVFTGWKLECSSAAIKSFYEKLITKLNFAALLPNISKAYYLYGDCFVIANIDCQKCGGTNEDQNGNECDHMGATWASLKIVSPEQIAITPGFLTSGPTYSFIPSEADLKSVINKDVEVSDELASKIQSREPIKLNPMIIHHFKHGSDPWSDYGMSLIKPLFPTLAYKDKLRQAQFIIAERHILPIKVVKIGDQNRPASQEDIDSVQEQLANIQTDPNLTIVTHHAFEISWEGAQGKVLQLTNEFELINEDLLDGMMLSKALLNGEGPNYGNAQVGLIAMERRLEAFRNEVARWIEEDIFKAIAQWSGLTTQGESGEEDLIYPKIKFNDLQLRDNTGKLQTMAQARANGDISAQTLVEAFDLPWDQEVERMRFEGANQFVNSQNLENLDYDLGFSVMQPTDGMMGGMAPPMTAPGAEMGMTPPMANKSKDDLFKIASTTMNQIYFDKLAVSEMTDNINKINVVTGRGYLKNINEELDFEYDDYFAEGPGIPLNYIAKKITTAGKPKEEEPKPSFYNDLEKDLYKLLFKMNIPLPFYAQYQAGSYSLDAAFPTIKLGIEADGAPFHSNYEQVKRDAERDAKLATQGWTILRFKDYDITSNPKETASVIGTAVRLLTQKWNT